MSRPSTSGSKRADATDPRQRGRAARSRTEPAYFLDRATEFTDDPDLSNPLWVARRLKEFPDLWGPIRAATKREDKKVGRKGFIDGDWAHVAVVMVLSAEPHIERFWHDHQDSRLWADAGFPSVPCKGSMYSNLARLLPHARAFKDAAYTLIRRAQGHDSRVARHLFADGTGYQAHAQLVHCCPDPDACAAVVRRTGRRPPRLVAKASPDTIKTEQHRKQRSPDRAAAPRAGEPESDGVAEDENEVATPLQMGEGYDDLVLDERFRYQWLGPRGARHLYRSRDRDAGTRRYSGPRGSSRVWHGGSFMAMGDHFTGGIVGFVNFPADTNEAAEHPSLYAEVSAGLAKDPVAITYDRGAHTKAVFEHNTRRGVASVIPWKEPYPGRRRRDLECDEFDRHGEARCKHCGGPTRREAFYLAGGEPRIRFSCLLRLRPDCAKSQSIACKTDWRMLLPVSMTDELYYSLRVAHKNKERVFTHWRSRYMVAGNDPATRLKTVGKDWHDLRASIAMLVEWLRICLRHGWMGSHRRRNTETPTQYRAARMLARVLRARERNGVLLPYGKYAEKAGTMPPGLPPPDEEPGTGAEVDAAPVPDPDDRPF